MSATSAAFSVWEGGGSVSYLGLGKGLRSLLTVVNVGDNYLGAFIGKESCRFGANALSAARDNGYLAGKHTLGVVEVVGDLSHAVGHDDCWRCSRVYSLFKQCW